MKNILWLDWWEKYIWIAYYNVKTNIIFPIWYIFNDNMFIYNLWQIIHKYKIWKIIIWYNKDNENNILKFKEEINLAYDVEIYLEDENYSSVESNDNDTLAAIVILKRYLKNWQNN